MGILIIAEDPGAVNYLAPLRTALVADGYSVDLRLTREVQTFAHDREISHLTFEGTRPETLLEIRKPNLVIVGTSENPDSPSLAMIDAARSGAIPVLAVVDMAVNAHRRFRGRSDRALTHVPDFLAVPDQATADAYVELGMPFDKIAVVGHPHYDVVRERRKELTACNRAVLRCELLPDAPANRPLWLFVAEGIDRLAPSESHRSADYSLVGRGKSDFRTTIVLEELFDTAAAMDPKPWIVVRLHPKMTPDDVATVRCEAGAISAGDDPLPLVWCADLVIGMTSMLLLEAYLLGRPTLSILPRRSEAAWLATTANGLTPVVTTRAEIVDALHALSRKTAAGSVSVERSAALGRNASAKLVALCGRMMADTTAA